MARLEMQECSYINAYCLHAVMDGANKNFKIMYCLYTVCRSFHSPTLCTVLSVALISTHHTVKVQQATCSPRRCEKIVPMGPELGLHNQ